MLPPPLAKLPYSLMFLCVQLPPPCLFICIKLQHPCMFLLLKLPPPRTGCLFGTEYCIRYWIYVSSSAIAPLRPRQILSFTDRPQYSPQIVHSTVLRSSTTRPQIVHSTVPSTVHRSAAVQSTFN